jgi:hypothetical protein
MLGYVSRAEQNARVGQLTSLWSTQSFGSRRTFTLESVLGLLTIVTRDPVVTVKIFIFSLIVTTFLSSYALAYSWTRRRSLSFIAGTLYVLSQASLSHWGSGQVNVEVLVATAPLFLLLWDHCLSGQSAIGIVSLTVLASVLLLARLDLLLYIIPVLVLQTLFRLFVAKDRRATTRALFFAVAVGAPTFVLINAYQLLPVIRGVRAPWVTTSALFSPGQFLDKSLPTYATALGFGREIGYFAFSNQETWYSNRFMSYDVYVVLASIVVLLAFGALLRRRDRQSIFLALLALMTTFAAKGGRAPLGGAYSWVLSHLGILASLRDPNRWLIFQAIAYSILAAAALTFIGDRVQSSLRGLLSLVAPPAIVLAMMVVMLAPVSPTLALGLQTWRPSPGEVALLRRIGHDHATFAVATVPYRQSFEFVHDHGYLGNEHDLGTESTLYTGHPSVGTGDWSQRGSDFVAYTSQLLRSGDPAFAKLLGSVGVKYLVSFNQGVVAPHLLDKELGGLYQQHSIKTMSGLTQRATNGGGTLYSVDDWAPAVTVRPNVALILGGRAGLAAFADMRGIDLRKWAAITADDAIATGGLPLLLQLIARSRAVVAGSDGVDEVGVLATPSLAIGAGFTSDPGLATTTINIVSDRSAVSGSMADQNQAPAKISVSHSSTSLTTGAARHVEFWSRVRFSPTAAKLSLNVDGRLVGSVTPVSAAGAYFRTIRLFTGTLSEGRHRFELAGTRSEFGTDYEVDQSKVVDQGDRARVGKELVVALAKKASETWYSLDPASAIKWSSNGGLIVPALSYAAPDVFWTAADRTHVRFTRQSESAAAISATSGRRYFTLVKHVFSRPTDWLTRSYMFLRIRGSASGQTLALFLSSSASAARVEYRIVDDSADWRTVALPIGDTAGSADPRFWRTVSAINVATGDRQTPIDLEMGPLSLSRELVALHATVPIVAGSPRGVTATTWEGTRCSAQLAGPAAPVDAGESVVNLEMRSAFLRGTCRIGLDPNSAPTGAASVAVTIGNESPTHHSFAAKTTPGEMVVLAQSYDVGWRLNAGGTSAQPVVVGSVSAGFEVQNNARAGDVRFVPQRVQPLGMWISGFSICGLVLGAVRWDKRRTRSARSP